ncbi:MAG: hypothetical protein OXG47_07660, partial [bacterium]|nr:hypothetical protein [bacterium]
MATSPVPRAAARRPLAAPRTNPPPPAGRRLRAKALLAAAALLAVLAGALASTPTAAQDTGGEVRIVARKHTDGRIEFALQQRQGDTWGDRQLPRSRYFPTTAPTGRWLASTPVDAAGGEVRIVARKHTDGRIEFALQQRQGDTWGDRQLPRSRYFPTT